MSVARRLPVATCLFGSDDTADIRALAERTLVAYAAACVTLEVALSCPALVNGFSVTDRRTDASRYRTALLRPMAEEPAVLAGARKPVVPRSWTWRCRRQVDEAGTDRPHRNARRLAALLRPRRSPGDRLLRVPCEGLRTPLKLRPRAWPVPSSERRSLTLPNNCWLWRSCSSWVSPTIDRR